MNTLKKIFKWIGRKMAESAAHRQRCIEELERIQQNSNYNLCKDARALYPDPPRPIREPGIREAEWGVIISQWRVHCSEADIDRIQYRQRRLESFK